MCFALCPRPYDCKVVDGLHYCTGIGVSKPPVYGDAEAVRWVMGHVGVGGIWEEPRCFAQYVGPRIADDWYHIGYGWGSGVIACSISLVRGYLY